MTVINMIVQPTRRVAWLISDLAITAPSGHLTEVTAKIIHSIRKPWAIGVTGNVKPRNLFDEIAKFQPDTVKKLENCLTICMQRAMRRAQRETLLHNNEPILAINGIYWCPDRNHPVGFTIRSNSESLINHTIDPFVWYETEWIMGGYHPEGWRGFLGRDVDVTDPESFDPIKDAVALVSAQRALPMKSLIPGANPNILHRVGGGVMLTKLTKRGVQSWDLHTFPDKIGELIHP